MRFMCIRDGEGGTALAVVRGDKALPLAPAYGAVFADVGALAAAGPAGLAQVERAVGEAPEDAWKPVEHLTPALPVTNPGKVVCLGLNYADHAKEGGHEVPDYPSLFMRVLTSLIPAGAPLVRPRVSETLDYEAELMVVIGRGGRYLAEEEALDAIFGYTLFNDGSVREYQRKTKQWTAGKNFDATGPVGSVVVTPDELPAGAAGLRIATRLNGQVMQDDNTDNMLFPVARTIAIVSEIMTLEPGDMIAMGTPQGVGHARRPPVWMKAGDVVEIEIEKIGVLRNPIVDEAAGEARAAAE
ncbi:MAG TPA: fumarylacetoacetate hydrolase family protein [Afifellaceae bacterium]|nr:fumarylacetoacetate hydrolase family protein [Afifellaceae bacterium]